jgi:hypothetical protein
MKKVHFTVVILIFFSGALFAADYTWDLVNALLNNDFQKIENILKENINTMSAADKRLVMSFSLTYSYGENTLKVFALLRKYNIRPDSFDLYTAINRNQPDAVIQLLLDNGTEPNGEILLLTMEKQRAVLAKRFIEKGVDVNYQYPLSKDYADGMTPLLYASRQNNLELVELLLEHGADINAKAKDGNTALSIAFTNGNTPIYNYLKEHGAVETENNTVPPSQTAGISSILDNQIPTTGISGILNNQIINFQPGTYRLLGGSADIRFSGSTTFGAINSITNGTAHNGSYRIEGSNMTLIMEGRTFVYRIDSSMSFSGNGEVWARIGN